MKDYRLSEIVTAITLDGQDATRLTMQKKLALKSVRASYSFDSLLSLPKIEKEDVKDCINKIKKTKTPSLKDVEEEATKELLTSGLMKKKLKLLSCDMNYYTSGIKILEYSTDREFYKREVEFLRSEMLEPGKPSLETIMLFTLVREAGAIHDIFSINEQNEIQRRMSELEKDEIYAEILSINFHSCIESYASAFIKGKRNLFKNQYLQGVAITFPFLDRRESIFIDFVVLGTDFATRQDAAIAFLRENGFDVERYWLGDLPLLRIDNMLYRTLSSSRMCKLPIQGMVIQPYYG